MCGLCYDIGLCNVLAIVLDWNIPGQVELHQVWMVKKFIAGTGYR